MASVLVVDDDPVLRRTARASLESDGHRVMLAANGTEALASVRDTVPDVVLLDVGTSGSSSSSSSGVDGWTVLKHLKSHCDEAISSVPVLMTAALGAEDDRLRGHVEGALRYLVKPVAAPDLCAAVREVLAGAPERDQRRRARTEALVELARRERGDGTPPRPGPRFARLERPRTRPPAGTADDEPTVSTAGLTDKQRELLRVVGAAPSVSDAAGELGVSRSNIYASLRRIARKVGASSVPDLLQSLRSGDVRFTDE